jgi:hypothetical protein
MSKLLALIAVASVSTAGLFLSTGANAKATVKGCASACCVESGCSAEEGCGDCCVDGCDCCATGVCLCADCCCPSGGQAARTKSSCCAAAPAQPAGCCQAADAATDALLEASGVTVPDTTDDSWVK